MAAKTTDKTVAKFIESLIQDHALNHDPEIPMVMGMMDGSEADVDSHSLNTDSTYPSITLELTDGTRFAIRVQQLQSK